MDTSAFFDPYFNNAEVNCLVILNAEGTILRVNQAFTNHFGYKSEDITGKPLSALFTSRDRDLKKPEQEIQQVLSKGQAHDDNFLVDSRGHALRCTGESLLVTTDQGEKYIVKDIINLQAKKQLQLFLRQTDELLESIFESSRDVAMIILDSSLKVSRVNEAFLSLFRLSGPIASGSRLSDLDHPFWREGSIRHDISNLLITGQPLRDKRVEFKNNGSDTKTLRVDAKVVEPPLSGERRVFLILEELQ